MPQHMNLKHLPPDELAIYNKLYPIKVALLQLKKGQPFALADLTDLSDRVSTLADDLALLRGHGTSGMTPADAYSDSDDDDDDDGASISSGGSGGSYASSTSSMSAAAGTSTSAGASTDADDTAPRNALDCLFDTVHQLVLELYAQADTVAPSMLPIYTQLMAIQNALEDMKADACFTLDDIVVYQRRLREIENQYVRDGKFLVPDHPGIPKGQAVLFAKLHACYRLASTLVLLIDTLDDALLPYHETVIAIQKDLHALAAQAHPPTTAILAVQDRLVALDAKRVQAEFRDPATNKALRGQQLVVAIMDHCYDLITDLCNKKDKVAPILVPLYDHLASLHRRLADLVDHRWDVRPQDLYPYERALHRIDAHRHGSGVFYSSPPYLLTSSGQSSANSSAGHLPDLDDHAPVEGGGAGPAPAGQAAIHYLLYKCHCHVTTLQATIEPVDPVLMHLHHHLIAVRKCLVELRRLGGPFTPQELYPFQLKLKSFDDQRVDGKFMVDGEIPAGQGVLHSLLSECYDILNELKAEVEWD
ncbi:hypothetical protein GGF32_008687 [Allomyces javanicus]|nr:hypothetical protein GGF32_008687 [Allomyces javanicus]